MARHAHEVDGGYKYDTSGSDIFTGDVAHAFVSDNRGEKYRNRAVTIKNGKAVLAGENERVLGSFQYFDSGKAVIRIQSAGTRYKNGGNTAIANRSKIIGDTRTIVSGGNAERGFVKAAPGQTGTYSENNVERADAGSGYVVNGGAAHAANTDPKADVLVAQSMGS